MKLTSVNVDSTTLVEMFPGRVDKGRLDATTEQDITRQQREDDAESMRNAAQYARRVRKRLGLTQRELARRIDVSLDTVRSWEQGKKVPTGPAKALFKIMDKAPELALSALD